eukprot:6204297-Pleurochrysis_carterae.AAC.2
MYSARRHVKQGRVCPVQSARSGGGGEIAAGRVRCPRGLNAARATSPAEVTVRMLRRVPSRPRVVELLRRSRRVRPLRPRQRPATGPRGTGRARMKRQPRVPNLQYGAQRAETCADLCVRGGGSRRLGS